MPPRRRLQITQESIDQQLQQIHFLDSSSTTENLEQLGPIIKDIHNSRQQDVYLRTLKQLIESKDAEIEKICSDNYQDFISSVSTLFTIKSYTTNLRDKISTLDTSVSQVGQALVDKKRALLQSKQTAANLDEAIDSLQALLRVLDVIDRVGQLVKEGKYWSALRSLDDVKALLPGSLSQTPLFQHILSSLPSLRMQIKDAVTASMKQWLLDIRNMSASIGGSAMEMMDNRTRRWRARREKDSMLKFNKVGSAVEVVTNEKTDFDVLNNEKFHVDFAPLYQCIHIYSTMESLPELQKSYEADRKAQADLLLANTLTSTNAPNLLQEIAGFFIIENHVSRTVHNFRSRRQVDELWSVVVLSLKTAIERLLANESEPESFLHIKEHILSFNMTLQSHHFEVYSLQQLIILVLEKYSTLLERQFSQRFDENISTDDYFPMQVDTVGFRNSVLENVWISRPEYDELKKSALPLNLPWSLSFYSCCQDIRNFVQKFYQYVEGVSDQQQSIDDLLGKSLDQLLVKHISDKLANRLTTTTTLSQIAQIVTNLEHFIVACTELEKSLTSLRSAQKGGMIRISAASSINRTLSIAVSRITSIITSKLDDFLELSEYDWTPSVREAAPSMYLYDLVNWLTTVVDSLQVKDTYKDDAYKGSVHYIAECLMEFVAGPNIPMLNENALSNVLIDIDFLEEELRRIDRSHLAAAFNELRFMLTIVLTDAVPQYLIPSIRQTNYSAVKAKKLQVLLEKLSKYGASTRIGSEREKGEKRRKEAEAIARLHLEDK